MVKVVCHCTVQLLCFCLAFELRPPLLPLAKPIPKQFKLWPHNNRILDKFLHAINKPVPITTRQKPTRLITLIRKLRIRFRQTRLVRNTKHAHPAAEDTERVHGIEGLGAAIDLDDGESTALGWAHAAA